MATQVNDESWAVALACAKRIGYVPTAFSQAIRLLVSDHLTNNKQIRAVTKYQVARVFRGPSFKATIYFASRQLAAEYLEHNKSVSIGDLVALYSPLDLAAFITCFFLNRRLKKITPEATWNVIGPKFLRDASIGALVGVAIPRLGYAPGLLIGSLKNLSLVLMTGEDRSKYSTYIRKLEAEKKLSDDDLERELWRTTSSQVSSMILTHLGFKSEIGETIAAAMNTKTPTDDIENLTIQSYRLAYLWSETFIFGRQQPLERLDGKYFPFEKDRAIAELQIVEVKSGEKTWLERCQADLTKEHAPHLFAPREEDPNFEIPEQLKDVFNLKELTSMEEEDFDKLVDQIDAEQATAKRRDDVIASKDLADIESEFA